ncbi:MAG: class IIb bacteriocin, lactobin A/cerein 7B family [Capnocytophaga sp.]|nr:class IIb bacteriocin, lactobin A/cerein 7B family [Capnocytophaga sp.]
MKKLQNIKGVEVLNANELREIEGGVAPLVIAIAVAAYLLLGTNKAH